MKWWAGSESCVGLLCSPPARHYFTFSLNNSLNLFQANVPFLNSLKTPENLWFSEVFRVYRKGTLAWNGLINDTRGVHFLFFNWKNPTTLFVILLIYCWYFDFIVRKFMKFLNKFSRFVLLLWIFNKNKSFCFLSRLGEII